MFEGLLGDGSYLGMSFSYAVQPEPKGLAEAFIIGEKFIDGDNVALTLGDNIFYGQSFDQMLKRAVERKEGATIFGYYVKNPSAYGVVEFDKEKYKVLVEERAKVLSSVE